MYTKKCNLPVAEASDKYVLIIARSASGPLARAELKLGQKIHRNNVPIMANVSEL